VIGNGAWSFKARLFSQDFRSKVIELVMKCFIGEGADVKQSRRARGKSACD